MPSPCQALHLLKPSTPLPCAKAATSVPCCILPLPCWLLSTEEQGECMLRAVRQLWKWGSGQAHGHHCKVPLLLLQKRSLQAGAVPDTCSCCIPALRGGLGTCASSCCWRCSLQSHPRRETPQSHCQLPLEPAEIANVGLGTQRAPCPTQHSPLLLTLINRGSPYLQPEVAPCQPAGTT